MKRRLTMTFKDKVTTCDPIDVPYNDYSRINFQNVIKKLAHYEDLEEQYRLIELPCAVGDTVWIIAPNYYKCSNEYDCQDYDSEEYLITWCQGNCPNGYHGIGAIQCVINCIEICNDKIYVQLNTSVSDHYYRCSITDVFLTKEEAEAKLKEAGKQE